MNGVDATALSTAGAGQADSSSAQRAQIQRLAQEFEAMFVAQMLKGMRESMVSDESGESGLGAQTMTETFDTEVGSALSRGGGIGLAKILAKAMQDRLGPAPADASATSPVGSSEATPGPLGSLTPRPLESVTPRPSESVTPRPLETVTPRPLDYSSSSVTSPFGWRRDPINGQVRFHAGTDLRAAYGEDVRALTGGTVTFAGNQRGYGTTVVVDDGAGGTTRYAHLSAATVTVGDRVQPGDVVARSGNSGRSTGPHLHVEVARNGQRLDPAPLLKQSRAVPIPLVDWTRSANED